MSTDSATWYIVKTASGQCQIVAAAELPESSEAAGAQTWGPYGSQEEAIARRIGLIRAGKCLPA